VNGGAVEGLCLNRMEIEEAGAEPSALAAAIHGQLPRLSGAVPVHAIAAALDITEIREAPTEGFEGALLMTPDRGYGSILVNASSSRQRRRFTIAHELGHFLNIWHRPTDPGGGFTCQIQDLAQPWSQQSHDQNRHRVQEREANRFAIELLAPRSLMRPLLKGIPDLAHVVTIAERLDLSREASARRYVESRGETLALVFSKAGVVRYIARSDAFPFLQLRKDDALPPVPATHQGDRISGHDEADPRDWGLRAKGAELIVQTLHQDEGFSITLLALEYPDSEMDDSSS
jgi:hypothetical protein